MDVHVFQADLDNLITHAPWESAGEESMIAMMSGTRNGLTNFVHRRHLGERVVNDN